MANVDRPDGFRPVKHLNGSPYNGQFNTYFSITDNLGMGDLVEQDAAGMRKNGIAYPSCDRVDATGDRIVGVVVGWEIDPSALDRKYHASSSTYAVHIADARDLIMEVQDDGATMTLVDIGLNVSPKIGSLDTATGLSNMEIDGSTANTTNTLTLRIMSSVGRPDNDSSDTTANGRYLVILNSSAYADLTAGV